MNTTRALAIALAMACTTAAAGKTPGTCDILQNTQCDAPLAMVLIILRSLTN